MKTGKELLPEIEALGMERSTSKSSGEVDKTSFRQKWQIGPNGVTYDYANDLNRNMAYGYQHSIKALLDPAGIGCTYKMSHYPLIFDPTASSESDQWKFGGQLYTGVEGAREYLRVHAFSHYENSAYGKKNSVFPLYAEYLRGLLKWYSFSLRKWERLQNSDPLDIRVAAQLLFADNADAKRIHALSKCIRKTVQDVVQTGPTEQAIKTIFACTREGLEIIYDEKFGEDLYALK